MRKLFTLVAGMLLFASCTQKQAALPNTESVSELTVLTWMEDKPGPTYQGRQIFSTVPDSLWEALGLQDGVPSSMSCVLLQTEGKNILIDAGLGSPESQLQHHLEEMNIKPEELGLIYISHMHGDHIGGLLNEKGEVVFPNAELYINRLEAEAWKTMDAEKSARQKQVLEAYKDHLHLFEGGDTLEGGVITIPAYGHTPGHTVFRNGGLLVISDLIHGAAIQLENPEYGPSFDMNPEEATEARVRILKYARENGLVMYGMHLPNPGFVQ